MPGKPSNEDLEQRIIELEEEILKKKNAEEALRESEEKYRSLVETTSDWVWEVDRNGTYTYTSLKVKDLLGYEPEDVIGKTPFDFMSADERERLGGLFRDIISSREPFESLENINLHRDGHRVVLETSGVPIFNSAGNLTGYRGIDRDITKRKRVEEGLAKKMYEFGERVKELNCLYGISNLSENPNILLEELFQNVVNLVPPAWQYPEITCSRILLNGNEYKTENFKETEWKQANDIIVQGEIAGTLEVYYLEENPDIDEGPFLNEERKLIKAITQRLGRIIEHKQAEEQLLESEERYRKIFEHAGFAINLIDIETGERVAFNREAHERLGYSREEFKKIHSAILDANVPKKEVIDHHKKIVEKGSDIFETKHITKNGKILDVLISAVSVKIGGRNYIHNISADISDRKRAEEEREDLIYRLRDALENVKALSGLLPICASCKKIRDDKGYWNQIETYIRDHSEAEFSHGICPECTKKLYPNL